MTGPSGNGLSICPLKFRIPSPKISRGNRSAYYPLNQSLFVYYSYLFGPIGEYVLTCVHLECSMHFFNFTFSVVLGLRHESLYENILLRHYNPQEKQLQIPL